MRRYAACISKHAAINTGSYVHCVLSSHVIILSRVVLFARTSKYTSDSMTFTFWFVQILIYYDVYSLKSSKYGKGAHEVHNRMNCYN